MRADPAALPLDVSRETRARLERFAALVAKWSPAINLVSRGDLGDIWSRHVADSAQVHACAPETALTWVDLGSGGGFPGAVVAILAAERRPELRVTCIEADARKAAFLRTVSRETGVAFDVVTARAETVPPARADVVSARALAPLDRLLAHAARHLTAGGTGLFPKGARHEEELSAARKRWRFRAERIKSVTNPQAVILKIGEISRV